MKTKHKKKLKKVVHHATKKKILKKKSAHRLFRSFFILVTTLSGSGLALAIAVAKPSIQIEVGHQQRKGAAVQIPIASTPTVSSADQSGSASWYAVGLPAPDALTCASTKYPRGTYLHVTNLRNGKSVVCLVNDYGPEFWTRRVIDLSRGSFRQIEDLGAGTAPVTIKVVPPPPASGINLPLPASLGQILGYNWCRQHNTAQFCEDHRSNEKP